MQFTDFSPHLLRFAIEIELQSTDCAKTAAMTALARLKKDKDYYNSFGFIEPMEKARIVKYKKRWKGKDGKWEYEYYDTPGEEKNIEKIKLRMIFNANLLIENFEKIGYSTIVGEQSTSIEALKSAENLEKNFPQNGLEHTAVLNSSGDIVFTKTGDGSEIVFNKEEYDGMRNSEILTHCHPNDRSFSAEDIFLALSLGIRELRVTTFKDTYFFKISQKENVEVSTTVKNRKFMSILTETNNRVTEIQAEKLHSGQMTKEQVSKEHREIVWKSISNNPTLLKIFNIKYGKVQK